ncbi:MAG: type III secretion protein R [Bradymonadia bacterium]|jgi:type III secretion protein R
MRGLVISLGAALLTIPSVAAAQELAATPSSPLITGIGLALLGLLPFLLVVTTSFAKFAVVLSILRSALGTQNVPPNVVMASLAVILTSFVMAPVFTAMSEEAAPLLELSAEEVRDVDAWPGRVESTLSPLRQFLAVNSGESEIALFTELRDAQPVERVEDLPLTVALPAFAITELSEAFQIGFLLFLPFLVLDLVVGSVLLSLGMHMLSPTTVSMPFKLLLFVLINGWVVLSESLVLGYTLPPGL